ncbi:uncharacterized protein LOC116020296 [Ipomoea triloba]|uniref:uncharacterized protein LOC116020296 n=1 Tax=Ipomoea triloba TaxID=35885 RepID=UPI00125D8253|nr:uncharacterized protein LOC116020296 [Ipomoea triloba]
MDHHHHSRHLMFKLSKFDDWKVRMQAHLFVIHDEMWDVITDSPIQILIVNANRVAEGESTLEPIAKTKSAYTTEERTHSNLDSIARDILYKTLGETFPRVRKCKAAKEMWETLMLIGKGDKQKKERKLTIARKKFEDFKIGATESIVEMETRFMKLLSEVADLGKEPTQKEINLKILDTHEK